jgi:ribosomal protein S18 acetylase RimI-like enzyme
MGDCTISLLTSSDATTVKALRMLIKQLTGRDSSFGEEELHQTLQDNASRLFVMRREDAIIGMLTLCIYHCPTARKVWVEDVVVDSAYRGQGLGKELVAFAIDYVEKNLAPCSLMLTSRPERIAANKLYRKAGFEQRQTNVYKIDI